MGTNQQKLAPSYDADKLERFFLKQSSLEQPTFRKIQESRAMENVESCQDESIVNSPKALDLHRMDPQFDDSVQTNDFNRKIELQFTQRSQVFYRIQSTLVETTKTIPQILFENAESQVPQILLETLCSVIEQDFTHDLSDEVVVLDQVLQSYILDKLNSFSQYINQMAKNLEERMKLSLMKKLGLFKLSRDETHTSLLSKIESEHSAQFIKNLSLRQLNDYIQYNSIEKDEDHLLHLKAHTNAILKADQVTELPVMPPPPLSTCNRTTESRESFKQIPQNSSEFLQKSSMLRAEISNLMSKHKQNR